MLISEFLKNMVDYTSSFFPLKNKGSDKMIVSRQRDKVANRVRVREDNIED